MFEHLYADNFSSDATVGTHYVVLAYQLRAEAEELDLPADQHDRYVWLSDAAVLARPDVHPHTQAYAATAADPG